MASRMPKGKDTVRTHVQMPKGWRKIILQVATKANVSMSSFIAQAAYDKAVKAAK